MLSWSAVLPNELVCPVAGSNLCWPAVSTRTGRLVMSRTFGVTAHEPCRGAGVKLVGALERAPILARCDTYRFGEVMP